MSSSVQNGLTVVVPVYNECDGIRGSIQRMRRICESFNGEIEVIFVDDGSTDGSENILADQLQSPFRVIRHAENRGYGASLKGGIRAAKYNIVAITDADDTYPDERIPEFYATMQEHALDMLVGARLGAKAHIPLIRRPPKWALNKLANYLCDYRIPDLNSGLRLMKKDVVERFFNILPDGFSFTTTITLALLANGLAVEYVPIEYARRSGSSKIRPVHDTLNFVQLICRTVMYFNPLRIFIPLSILVAVSAFLVLLLSWAFSDQILDVTFGTLIVTAVNVLIVGLLADLVDKRL
ncbi:MAG: glycosyltransferase family 2 protein [Candidatus Krumholzibacteria bacterium]|nr:glycosyltransferase family 2 protein [Candidatus Krumholzibacteria bacterium]